MGYYVNGGGDAEIKKENFRAVTETLLFKWPGMRDAGLNECSDLERVLDYCGFDVCDFDDDGNLVFLSVCDRRLWDQAETLAAISPYVEEARLEMTGEDGEKWLWAIKDYEFYECAAIIRYDGDPFEKEERQ